MCGHINGQTDGKTEVQKDGCTDRLQADRQMHGPRNIEGEMKGKTNRRLDRRQTDEQMAMKGVNRQMNEQTIRWTDRYMDGQLHGQTVTCRDSYMERQIHDRQIHGRTDTWTDRQMGGQTK